MKQILRRLFSLIALLFVLAPGVTAQEIPDDMHTINLLVDCSHEYSFNLSDASRTENEIFPGINCVTACQAISKLNLEPINAMVVLMDGKLPYLPEDAPALLNYVREGGGLHIDVRTVGRYSDSLQDFLSEFGLEPGSNLSGTTAESVEGKAVGLYPESDLAASGWPELPGVRAREPFPKASTPSDWRVLYRDEKGNPVVKTKAYGKGLIVCDTAGLYGAAIGKKVPQQQVMRKLLETISKNKVVEPMQGGGGWQFSDGYRWDQITTVEGGLRIHHNDYSGMYVESSKKAFRETVNYLQVFTGLDEKQKAAQIKELHQRRAENMHGTPLDLDVSGVNTLTLISTDGGDGIGSDHSIFAANFLVDAAGRKTKLLLEDAKDVQVGYGEPWQDALPGGSAPFSIGGTEFATGIFLHANGRMTFELGGNYERFLSHVGCYDRAAAGSVGFRVLADGREIWNDGKIYFGGVPGGNPDDVNYVPEGILFQLKYLPCIGAGFLLPQGAAVDLPPALREDWQVHLGMMAHEMGHAWSYPFLEPLGEEGSAFIFNNLILHRHHGQKHGDSVTRRLMNYLKNPDLDDDDLADTRSDFKYYMFIDLMIRQYGEDIFKNYNLLKYALLKQEGAEWNPHVTAWLWSIAAGEDVFPFFNTAFDSTMDPAQVKLPEQAMQAGFDPEKIGQIYGVPLERLPKIRNVFQGLNDFSDVRDFYDREVKEKGHPAVEG